MPNALEFHSGQSYYFISTSSPLNYTTRVGGYCRTNNMKVDTYSYYYDVSMATNIIFSIPRLCSKWLTETVLRRSQVLG